MTKMFASLIIVLLAALVLASPVAAQYDRSRPWDRGNNQRTTPQQGGRPGTTLGTPAPPSEASMPENQQTLPQGEDPGEPPTIEDGGYFRAMEAARQGLVAINNGQSRSLGFIIKGNADDKWFVVTNFRTIASSRWVDVRFVDGSKIEVDGLYNHDEPQDLALLQVKASSNRKIKPLELGDRNPRPNEAVFGIGDPRRMVDWAGAGKTLKIVEGPEVDAPFGSEWIQTEAIISPSNAGGPLMAGNGKVVGVLTSAGKPGRGPHLSVSLSKVREMIDAENFGLKVLPFPSVEGGFSWPEERTRRQETYAFARAQAAALAMQKNLTCSRCEGHGVLVTPIYRVDANGNRTKAGERRNPCELCGGAGIIIKPAIHELTANLSRMVLNPDDKWTDEQKAQIKPIVEDTMNLVAVNRQVLADAISPIYSRILAEPDKNRDSAVTFLAQLGPQVSFHGRTFQWVRLKDSEQWFLTYGANIRTPTIAAVPGGGDPRARHRAEAARRNAMRTNYIMVAGILRGNGTIEANKKVYTAPLVEALDLVMLRP